MISAKSKIASFTIFEVTMVLAIMSVLILIITLSNNRFNEQLKVANEIKRELNTFKLIRSNISQDFYHSNNARLENEELILTKGIYEVRYKIIDGFLSQIRSSETISLGVQASEIFESTLNDVPVYHIVIPWKDDEIDLAFYYKPSVDLAINAFFEDYNEQ